MKLSIVLPLATSILATLAMALPEPAPALPAATVYSAGSRRVDEGELSKRDNAAVVVIQNLPCHLCPRIKCRLCPHHYNYGEHITLKCYTRDDTTVIDGDAGWALITGTSNWVPLVHGHYVSWDGELPYCTASDYPPKSQDQDG